MFYIKTNCEMSLPDMSPESPEKKENQIYWQNQTHDLLIFVTIWATVVPAIDEKLMLWKYLGNLQKII